SPPRRVTLCSRSQASKLSPTCTRAGFPPLPPELVTRKNTHWMAPLSAREILTRLNGLSLALVSRVPPQNHTSSLVVAGRSTVLPPGAGIDSCPSTPWNFTGSPLSQASRVSPTRSTFWAQAGADPASNAPTPRNAHSLSLPASMDDLLVLFTI